MKLIFPSKILDQHLVVLGKTGAGKSSALRHVVEHLLSAGDRVCVIDPKGDWYGLKSSADGKGAGFPVVLFGDFKNAEARDVPINEASGKPIAELVVGGNRPCVIGFRGWTQGAMHRFWIDFASAVFNTIGGKLFLVIDEVHNFAPKGKVISPEVGMCLHWSNRLMNEGRGIGLVNLIASQRPQKVHNDTLTACETLVAMRVVHAADRGAIEEWVDGCGDREQGKEVLNTLASLTRGEAWVWSPDATFGPKRLTFPMFATYDSFAPPQLLKRITKKGWADVDLSEVTAKLSTAIAEAKANDPKELKAEIVRLKRELEKQGSGVRGQGSGKLVTDEKAITRAVAERDREWQPRWTELQNQHKKLLRWVEQLSAALMKFLPNPPAGVEITMPAIAEPAPSRFHAPPKLIDNRKHSLHQPAPQRTTVVQSGELRVNRLTESGLPGGDRDVLIALAQHGQCDTRQLAAFTGKKERTIQNILVSLRGQGYVHQGHPHRATDEGLAALGEFDPLPVGDALQDYWLQKLPGGEAKVLEELIARHPSYCTTAELSEVTGLAERTVQNVLVALSSRRIIDRGRGSTKASDTLFGSP